MRAGGHNFDKKVTPFLNAFFFFVTKRSHNFETANIMRLFMLNLIKIVKCVLFVLLCHLGAPVYLSNCFKLHVPKRNLRSSNDRLWLDYPRTRVQAGDKSFTVCASKLWNNIPVFTLGNQFL